MSPSLRLLHCSLTLCVGAAHATTIVVTSELDTFADDGVCTLREALASANSNSAVTADCPAGQAVPTVDVIAFAIPGAGPHTIAPTSYIGPINESLTIDGSTQPGAVPNTATPLNGGLNGTLTIEISGQNCVSCTYPIGIGALASGEVTLRGLALNRFAFPVNQSGSSAATFRIEGCYIGTDLAGLVDLGSINNAITTGSGVWKIGGKLPAQRNLIIGGFSHAIWGQTTASMTIEGNLIGTDRSGLVALPTGSDAINFRLFAGASLQLGGTDPLARNVIGGATGWGAYLLNYGTVGDTVRVEGNFIGVGSDGATPLGNLLGGVRFGLPAAAGSGWARIGGSGSGGNLIAHNVGPGIAIVAAGTVAEVARNVLRGNAIGIDLSLGESDGRTPNDVDGADTGPNNLQNHPELRSVIYSAGQYIITYRVDSAPAHATYPLRIDFYVSAAVDDAEGIQWLASDTIDMAAAQQWRSISIPGPGAVALVATATDAIGRSSEFSLQDRIFADAFE